MSFYHKNIKPGIIAALSVGWTLVVVPSYAQSSTAAVTIKNYSITQKRLLAINTFQFSNFVTQNNLDRDSIMTIACLITNTPLLFPYIEGLEYNTSKTEELIAAGKIGEAISLLGKIDIKNKILSFIELGMWYVHKPGAKKFDLDSASRFIENAAALCKTGVYAIYQTECLFLQAELFRQKQDIAVSKQILDQILFSAKKQNNLPVTARVYQQMGVLFPSNDSMQLSYYRKSFDLYHQLQLKEKEIELLVNIALCEWHFNLRLMEKDLQMALSLMSESKFKHVLFTQNMLAYVYANLSVYAEALQHATEGIENMKWSGIVAVAGNFYYRTGSIYQSLGKNEEALSWFNKSLDAGTNETHMYWYKSLFYIINIFLSSNKVQEIISLINKVTTKFPTVTLWEEMQILAIKGDCYRKLNQPALAGKVYLSLLALSKENPLADPYGEMSENFFDAADFYVSRKDLKKARLFLQQGQKNVDKNQFMNAKKYYLLSKVDSMEGNYKSALQNHILYKLYNDSLINIDQRNKMEELTLKYAAEKKDNDIKSLKQQGIVQQAELNRNKLDRNIMIAGTLLLLIISALLFNRYTLKQRSNKIINNKNASLQRLLDEKEWLLKEVHHRVKNNLHTVISLLDSQASYLQHDALKAIETSQHRIYAMSLIHQKLYQTEDIKTIDMSVYIHEFIGYLKDSFGVDNQIYFSLNIQSLKLGVAQAIPIGLIINEAVTNAIKYAFPHDRKGIIQIIMCQATNQIILEISDDGVGIKNSKANYATESLGLKLIRGLSEDIGGNLCLTDTNGTTINIVFNVDPLDQNKILSNINENNIFA